MKYNVNITCEVFSFENQAENELGWLFPDLILCFKKVFYEVKTSG